MQQQAVAVDQIQSNPILAQRPNKPSARKVKSIPLTTRKKVSLDTMNKRQKRLFSFIVVTLIEHGNLDDRKAAVVALANEAKVAKSELRDYAALAHAKHPEINQVMRLSKKIRALKASGKKPSMAMFNHVKPDAQLAGKDDLWLSEKLGFMPAHLQDELDAAENQKSKKSLFGIIKG